MLKNSYYISKDHSILDAMKKIEENKNGFVIIVNKDMEVIGTLTDGDIRRALINGSGMDEEVNGINNFDFKSVYVDDHYDGIITNFQSNKITFLPIIDRKEKLVNVITKRQLYVILMQNLELPLDYDFTLLNESIIDHEIVNKPWGFFKTNFLNDFYRAKILKVAPLQKLSLQKHKHRDEHWVIIRGSARLTIGEHVKLVTTGDYIWIPRGCKHRIENISEEESLMISEIQIGDYFGEDDIERYEDVYGRE